MLFSAWQFTRREENENRLALVASAVASRNVEISCPGFCRAAVEITPNAGWVDFDQHGKPGDKTNLSASTCRGLERVWRGDQTSFGCLISGSCDEDTLRAVWGVVTLAHESWHLRGVTDEAETQCYAIQTVEQVALRLGVSRQNAHVIAVWVALDDAVHPLATTTHRSVIRAVSTTAIPRRLTGPAPSRLGALDKDAGARVCRERRVPQPGDDELGLGELRELEQASCRGGGGPSLSTSS